MTDFSTRQKGISIGAKIDIIGDTDSLPQNFLEGAKGFIVLRNPLGVESRLQADTMTVEASRFIVLGYDDTETGRSNLPDGPIFNLAGQWLKWAEVELASGRVVAVPISEAEVINVS